MTQEHALYKKAVKLLYGSRNHLTNRQIATMSFEALKKRYAVLPFHHLVYWNHMRDDLWTYTGLGKRAAQLNENNASISHKIIHCIWQHHKAIETLATWQQKRHHIQQTLYYLLIWNTTFQNKFLSPKHPVNGIQLIPANQIPKEYHKSLLMLINYPKKALDIIQVYQTEKQSFYKQHVVSAREKITAQMLEDPTYYIDTFNLFGETSLLHQMLTHHTSELQIEFLNSIMDNIEFTFDDKNVRITHKTMNVAPVNIPKNVIQDPLFILTAYRYAQLLKSLMTLHQDITPMDGICWGILKFTSQHLNFVAPIYLKYWKERLYIRTTKPGQILLAIYNNEQIKEGNTIPLIDFLQKITKDSVMTTSFPEYEKSNKMSDIEAAYQLASSPHGNISFFINADNLHYILYSTINAQDMNNKLKHLAKDILLNPQASTEQKGIQALVDMTFLAWTSQYITKQATPSNNTVVPQLPAPNNMIAA